MRPLSQELRSNIIFMLENGHSIRKIAVKLGVGKSTIGEIHSGIELPMKENHGGHPSKLTPHDHRHLI